MMKNTVFTRASLDKAVGNWAVPLFLCCIHNGQNERVVGKKILEHLQTSNLLKQEIVVFGIHLRETGYPDDGAELLHVFPYGSRHCTMEELEFFKHSKNEIFDILEA